MKIFKSINSFHNHKKTIVTIGTFDGVHVGHQKIIEKLILNAKTSNCESLILTFFPHPRMILQSDTEILLLNTINERGELLANLGLENLIIHSFDHAFSQLTAGDFVKQILVDQLNIKKIVIGHDHRFGKNRTADFHDLEVYGGKYGFEVEQIGVEEIDAVVISSTKIRVALEEGNVGLANEYLGYCYFLTGKVQKGKQLGRTLGFPTANLKIEEKYKLIPKNGVYIVKSIFKNKPVFGMMNIGNNPTVNGENLSIEVYFLHFNQDLYDTEIKVSFLHYIRPEKKFSSIEALKQQLEIDKESTLAYIERYFPS